MNFKLTLLASFSAILLLSGCSKSTLNVSHYSKTKTTIVDMGNDRKYQIDNSEKIAKKQRAASVNTGGAKSNIYKSSGICSRLMYVHLAPLGRNTYYINDTKADVYARYNGLDCKTESVGFLDFHECGTNYIVTFDEFSDDETFLNEKMYLTVKDKECFEAIKRTAKQ